MKTELKQKHPKRTLMVFLFSVVLVNLATWENGLLEKILFPIITLGNRHMADANKFFPNEWMLQIY